MAPAVLGELLARERRDSRPALTVFELDRTMNYHEYLTTAYKAGNVLRYLGVSRGSTVAVAPKTAPEPILAFLGAAQLGAKTTFDPSANARVTLVPVADEDSYSPSPGSNLAVYGGPPRSPRTTHWEAEVWSENPTFPATTVDPDSPVLVANETAYTHRDLLETASTVVEELDLTADSRLAIRTPLSNPVTIAGGVFGSLLAGGTAVFVADPTQSVAADCALVAADSNPPEATWLSADKVRLG